LDEIQNIDPFLEAIEDIEPHSEVSWVIAGVSISKEVPDAAGARQTIENLWHSYIEYLVEEQPSEESKSEAEIQFDIRFQIQNIRRTLGFKILHERQTRNFMTT
jgi:hypothetical protein